MIFIMVKLCIDKFSQMIWKSVWEVAMEGEMLVALLETNVAMEGEMLGALLVADVYRKICIKWQSHENCWFGNQLPVNEDMMQWYTKDGVKFKAGSM